MYKTVLVLIVASIVAGQTPSQPSANQAVKSGAAQKTATRKDNARFTCPDALAAEACKSFEELYKAGDESVRPSNNARTGYVCFRPKSDEFFILQLFGQESVSGAAISREFGYGYIGVFAHGVEDSSTPPGSFSFSGAWTGPLSPTFTAAKINDQSVSDPNVIGLVLDPEQFMMAWRYKNEIGKDTDYRLVVRRSTGRYYESFNEKSVPLAAIPSPTPGDSPSPGAPGQPQAPRPIGPKAQAAYQQMLIQFRSMGIDISQFPPVLHDEAELDELMSRYPRSLADRKTIAETQEAEARAALDNAEARLKSSELNLAKNSTLERNGRCLLLPLRK
jgi:hypothetical protein